MEPDLFVIKLGTNITIGYEINGQKLIIKDKEQNLTFNYFIEIDANIKINLNDIISCIMEEKYGNIGNDIELIYTEEIYRLKILKSGKIYLLEELFVKLFEKIKKIIHNLINHHLHKAIIIYNNISYELRLILHRATLISRITIINFIDLNKTIKIYLDYNSMVKNNSLALIKIDEKLEISVFDKTNNNRIFHSILNKNEINFDNLKLKKGLNEIKNKKDFEYLKNIMDKLILKSYGNKKVIDKIYIYKNIDSEYLNEISIFGAIYSNNNPISKESILIFNFIDFCDNYPLKQLKIQKNVYKINQKILEINLDDNNIPFEDCYFRHIKIQFFKNDIENMELVDNIITFYYYQKNFYFCTKDIDIATSSEFIFFKTFPIITINDLHTIDIQEKFENNQIFKRVNILNVNREKIKLNGKSLIYYDYLKPSDKASYEISEDELSPNILFLIGKNLNVLSYFDKEILYNSSFVDDKHKLKFLNLLKNNELIDKDDSIQNLIEKKDALLNMVQNCLQIFNRKIIEKYLYGNIKNFNQYDADILIKYGKYLIFKQIFYKNNNLEIDEINYIKYKNIMTSLNLFIEKCKLIEKDSLYLARLYFSACNVLIHYLQNSNNFKENIIFDIINFGNDSIYKDAYENNLNLILNLTKKSFLYPYFIQFNSSPNESKILIDENNNYIETFTISMNTLNQLKLDLIKSLPKYGIRICFSTNYFSNTILRTDIAIYNEKKLFGHFLTHEELGSHNDIEFTKRVKISFLQKHEIFNHYKNRLNKQKKTSLRGLINYDESIVYFLDSKTIINKSELLDTLEYIMTKENSYLIDNLFKCNEDFNLKELYNINIFLERNNDELIKILKKIQNEKINFENFEESHKINTSSNNNKKNVIYDDENMDIKDIKEKNKDSDDEFERRKIEMICANPIIKYTFEKNTIQEYKRINGKLVPFNNNNK